MIALTKNIQRTYFIHPQYETQGLQATVLERFSKLTESHTQFTQHIFQIIYLHCCLTAIYITTVMIQSFLEKQIYILFELKPAP